MQHEETHLVTATNGPRPAGKPDECFYCKQKVGERHERDCVCRQRTVKVQAVIEYVIAVPEDNTVEQIEFHRNEISWCKGNMLRELEKIEASSCLCSFAEFKFLREATKEDEEDQGFALEDM